MRLCCKSAINNRVQVGVSSPLPLKYECNITNPWEAFCELNNLISMAISWPKKCTACYRNVLSIKMYVLLAGTTLGLVGGFWAFSLWVIGTLRALSSCKAHAWPVGWSLYIQPGIFFVKKMFLFIRRHFPIETMIVLSYFPGFSPILPRWRFGIFSGTYCSCDGMMRQMKQVLIPDRFWDSPSKFLSSPSCFLLLNWAVKCMWGWASLNLLPIQMLYTIIHSSQIQ